MDYSTLTNVLQEYGYSVDTTRQQVISDYVDSFAASGQKIVNVGNGANFIAGMSVILWDGNTTYENAVIDSIATNALTMVSNLTNTFAEGSRVIRGNSRVLTSTDSEYKWTNLYTIVNRNSPDFGTGVDGAFTSSGDATWSSEKNYSSINIQVGHTITVSGNFAIKCQSTATIAGTLSAYGQGYAGGASDYYYSGSAYQGSSYPGAGTRTINANGGGGGGGIGSGTSGAGAGGGGGYGGGGNAGNGTSGGNGGYGGSTYNSTHLNNTFTETYMKGSGGGGGGAYYNGNWGNNAGAGGAGGGIIHLHCKNLVVTGAINCNGVAGTNATSGSPSFPMPAGGGGSGGTIYILCSQHASIGSGLVTAVGGSGGTGSGGGPNGGGGGSGRIRIEASKFTGTSSPTYSSVTYSTYDEGVSHMKYTWYTTPKTTLTRTVSTICAVIKYKTSTMSSVTMEGSIVSSGADESFGTGTLQSSSVTGNYTTSIYAYSAETASDYVTGRFRFIATGYVPIEVTKIFWAFS